MGLNTSRVVLTGAAAGIGRATADALAARGARLFLVDRDAPALTAACDEITARHGTVVHGHEADLTDLDALDGVVVAAQMSLGAIDVLVNNAGLQTFAPFEQEDLHGLEAQLRVNVLAPMGLTRAALPAMIERGAGRIVNMGSIFGSIAFAYFAAYSSTKFAMRGFSEALRRELEGTGVGVTYVAPRATRTGLASVTGRMAEAVGMKMDDPTHVAAKVVAAIEGEAKERYLGQPEGIFVRLNALMPRLVDMATRGQNRKTRPFAVEASESRRPSPIAVAHGTAESLAVTR